MQICSIIEDVTYKDGGPSVQVLFESKSTKEIRIAFLAGQQMKAHKSNFPIVIHVVQGAIDFGAEGQRRHLASGGLVALEENVVHDLIALEKSVVRLSIQIADGAERIQRMVEQ